MITPKELEELVFEATRADILHITRTIIREMGCTIDEANEFVLPRLTPVFNELRDHARRRILRAANAAADELAAIKQQHPLA
jgi:hypothetical protein